MCVTAFWMGHGSFAEECLVAADSAFAVPDGLTDAEAAGFWIPHLTAWIGLVDRGGIAAGDRLAVLGAAGGSGIAAVQLGHALGAHVIAVVSDDERAEFCRGLGADVDDQPPRRPARAPRCATRTDGRGVDLVYDPVGGALAEDAAGALGAQRAPARGRVRERTRGRRSPRTISSSTNTSLVGVFAGGYTRDELDDIHARLSALVARRPPAQRGHATRSRSTTLPAALQRMADRARRRQARDGAVTAVPPRPSDFDLDADEIVTAAVEIFEESGLDAVSMRSVSARLGVSPVPLYSRVGNKDALLDAIADRLLADLAPAAADGEPWAEYAARWARELRVRLRPRPRQPAHPLGPGATRTSRRRGRSSR